MIAFVIHLVLASSIDGPRAFADELLYFDTGSSIAEGDGLAFRGEPYRYAPLYPALLAAVHVVAADREVAYELAKAMNALLFALTRFRSFCSRVASFRPGRARLPQRSPWPSHRGRTSPSS